MTVSQARFLLDRSVGGRLLIARLREGGWDARTLAEEYGDERAQRMPDEEWIAEGTIYVHDARVVTFARGELTALEMGDLCMRHERAIHRLAQVQPPFVMALSETGLRRKRLNVV